MSSDQSNVEEIRQKLQAARWQLAIEEAREDLIAFIRFMTPDPENYDDPTKSTYVVKPHHRLIADVLMDIEKGKCLRAALSTPPQHGKSSAVIMGMAWMCGRHPRKNFLFGTYNADFARDRGAEVRAILLSPRFRQVFPTCRLDPNQKDKSHMVTTYGGQLNFVGRGGGGTGRPADFEFIDDPIKDQAEAESEATIDDLWQWFTKVFLSRARGTTAIMIIHTRWVMSDLIGRLCDPEHPEHNPKMARLWRYVNIPAIFEPGHEDAAKLLGAKIGDVLWPEEFHRELLEQARALNPEGFNALYQGRPVPDSGDYFKLAQLREYRSVDEIPHGVVWYGASDHALGTKVQHDLTCMGVAGMDSHGTLWIHPDLVWSRIEADQTVEEMLRLMQLRRPAYWFAESENIAKAIGPFLRKRMSDARITVPVEEVRPSSDKRFMARNAQGMVHHGKVMFPAFASWWPRAKKQLLQFPKVKGHDDFVSFLSVLCFGLDLQYGGKTPTEAIREIKPGTYGHLKFLWKLAEEGSSDRFMKVH